MKRFELGVWLFLGSLALGLALILAYITLLLHTGVLYVYGYGNPPWLDFFFVSIGPIAATFLLLGLVLMYGWDDK